MKLDRFDILSLTVAAALAAAAFAVPALTGTDGAVQARPLPARIQAPAVQAPPDKLAQAGSLLEAGAVSETVAALEPLAKQYPSDSQVHALLGQAYSKKLDFPAAMREFRTALLLDPDYVDKKSGKFIGKRIKAAEKDGMAEAKAALANNPGDLSARAALKDAYYLERMLAGGCE